MTKVLGTKKNRSFSSLGTSLSSQRKTALSSTAYSTNRTVLGREVSFQTAPKSGADHRSFSALPSTTSGGGGISEAPLSMASATSHGGGGGHNDDDDSWMYSFGIESEAKAEERHNARMENEACKKRIAEIEGVIDNEESIANGLRKDDQRNRDEMTGILGAVLEMKNDITVDETQRESLEQSLRSNVMQPMVDGPTTDGSATGGNGGKENDASVAGKGNVPTVTPKTFLQDKKTKMNEFSSATDKSILTKIKKEAKDLQDEIAALRNTIVSENLEVILEQKQTECDERCLEMESETSRMQQIRTTIRDLRAQGEQNALGLASKRAILENNKAKAAAELSLKKAELEAAEAEFHRLKTEEEWTKELGELEKERDSITQVIAEAEDMIAKGKTSKKERESIETAIQDLKVTEKELMVKLDAQKEVVASAQADLSKAKKDAEAAQFEKVANDQYQAETVWPAESQIKDINQDKKRFTNFIDEISAQMKTDDSKANDEKQEKQLKLAELEKDEKAKQEHIDALSIELEELSEKKKHEMEELEKDKQGILSEIASVSMMTKEEEARLVTLKDTINHALAEATDTYKEAERHKGILEGGVELLTAVAEFDRQKEKETEAKVQEILNGTVSPVKPDHTRTVEAVLSQLERIVPSQGLSSSSGVALA